MPVTQPQWNDLRGKHLHTGRTKIVGIVLHDTAGSGTHGDTKYLANPSDGRNVCVEFTVEADGSIWKLNPDIEAYWTAHAGRATKFQGLRNQDVARATIGIELPLKAKLDLAPRPLYSDARVRSVAHLCAWLCEKYNLESSDITTHRQIITDGSRSDPRQFPFEGPNGFWQYFWEFMGHGEDYEAAVDMVKTPTEEVVAAQRTHRVVAGETLSALANRYYNDYGKYPLIKEANKLKTDTIVVDQILIIPAKET
jgi:N-acetyl-anhydromuramyl-L-alanine amidase AmpD